MESVLHMKMRSKNWCSDLAKVILKPQEPGGSKRYARDLSNIPLIPLVDGTWRCPPVGEDQIYFPVSLGTTIPPGLPLSIVDEEACYCRMRTELFRLLGVKDCDVANVIDRIFAYHAELSSANAYHIIAHLKYLYELRAHLEHHDMAKILIKCSGRSHYKRGTSVYVDTSIGGELQQLFSGYSEANFLDDHYMADYNAFEKAKFVEWLAEAAGVAVAPRLTRTFRDGLHKDFKWLLANKQDRILPILRQHWRIYNRCITDTVKNALANYGVECKPGWQMTLSGTYVPLPTLVRKAEAFCDAEECNFLVLPSGDLEGWKFLSNLGVGVDDGLDFHLWVLNQPAFNDQSDWHKSKLLFLAIQSRAFSPGEEEKVR